MKLVTPLAAAVGAHQEPNGRVVHRLEGPIIALALLVVPAMIISESHPSPDLSMVANILLWVTWGVLALDLLLVLMTATRQRAALRAHWFEFVVVLLALPLPTLLLPPGARFLRLLRLTRVGQLGVIGVRVLNSERRLGSRARLMNIALLTSLIVVTASLSVVAVDPKDFPNVWRALWWAIVTVTTVGYGDITPHSVGGRLIAVVLMLLGIGFLSMLTATIAASFIQKDATAEHHVLPNANELASVLARIEARLDRIEQQGRPAPAPESTKTEDDSS